MNLASILSAAARNGVSVRESEHNKRQMILTKGSISLDFHVNDNNTVSTIWERSPLTDIMTDCFCDTSYDTIKSAMHRLNPTGEQVRPTGGTPSQEVVEDVVVRKNEERGGVEIKFPGKPAGDVIKSLKDHGFRWSPFNSVWWKKYTNEDMEWAVATFLNAPEVQPT